MTQFDDWPRKPGYKPPKYTPEPWKQYGTKIYTGEGATLRDMVGVIHNPGNAMRVVACVNACKGINPEAVGELLAACEAMLDSDALTGNSSKLPVVRQMQAAIAKEKP